MLRYEQILNEHTRTSGGLGYSNRYIDLSRAGRLGYRIPVEAIFSAPVHTGPGGSPSLLFNGYRVIPGVNDRDVALTAHPQLALGLEEKVELCL